MPKINKSWRADTFHTGVNLPLLQN